MVFQLCSNMIHQFLFVCFLLFSIESSIQSVIHAERATQRGPLVKSKQEIIKVNIGISTVKQRLDHFNKTDHRYWNQVSSTISTSTNRFPRSFF